MFDGGLREWHKEHEYLTEQQGEALHPDCRTAADLQFEKMRPGSQKRPGKSRMSWLWQREVVSSVVVVLVTSCW
jgi:hypothetical protein